MNADGFTCGFCGAFTPWRLLAGWTWRRRIRFCECCADLMDRIYNGEPKNGTD